MAWFLVLLACCLHLHWTSASGCVVVYTMGTDQIVDEFSAQPADFGVPLHEHGVPGALTLANPPDGCSALAPPPDYVAKGTWAVLIARYNCTFDVKIRNAQAAGFGLAIVHNVNSSDLETMMTKHPEGIDIPSVFVSDFSGFALAEKYLHGTGYYVVAEEYEGREPKSMNTLLLWMMWIVVGALSVFIMIGILVMKCIRDKPSQRLLGKGAPCEDKLSSEDTVKGPARSKEEEANSCISPSTVA